MILTIATILTVISATHQILAHFRKFNRWSDYIKLNKLSKLANNIVLSQTETKFYHNDEYLSTRIHYNTIWNIGTNYILNTGVGTNYILNTGEEMNISAFTIEPVSLILSVPTTKKVIKLYENYMKNL